MEALAYFILFLGIIWFGQMAFIHWTTRKSVGRSTDPLLTIIPELAKNKTSLVYFHSPGCGPCKKMLPHIKELQADTGRVFPVDISEHPEVARKMQIKATPTVILVNEGKIAALLLGNQKKEKLRNMLN